MQQTRVTQGLPYYEQFIKHYPTIADLALASEQDVLKLWQGLGYYSRARNLQATAKYVSNELNGTFPSTYSELLKLKGVGQYTAAAIASICYNECVAVVDGNVYRALSRLFGIYTPINTTQGKHEFLALATKLINQCDAPGNHNQAVMEFGAVQCTPKQPECNSCIFNKHCVAYRTNSIGELPAKNKSAKARKRYFNYLVISDGSSIVLNKREHNDIWASLYDFPLIETTGNVLSKNELLKHVEFNKLIEQGYTQINKSVRDKTHVLSHQIITARFFEITVKSGKAYKGFYKINRSEVHDYPIPKLIENYMTAAGY